MTTLLRKPKYARSKSVKPKTKVDKSLANRIKKIEKEVEWKYTDYFAGYTPIPHEGTGGNPSWLVQCINTSVLGASQAGQRIGTQITAKALHVRCSLQQQPSNILDNRVRCVIFWYKNSNTLLPVPNQLFDGALAPPTFAFYNDQYKESYKVIYDETFEMKPLDWNGTTTTIGDQISLNRSFKLGRHVKYILGTGAGTYADILDNSLYIAFMTSANSGAMAVNNPQVVISTRCYYVDA